MTEVLTIGKRNAGLRVHVVLADEVVVSASPYLAFMDSWGRKAVLAHCTKMNWTLTLPDHEEVVVHTDGSCWPTRNGDGGWAFVMRYKDRVVEHWGCGRGETNNTMELTAIFRAMQRLNPTQRRVNILADSQYALNCLTLWHQKWVRNGWRNSQGEPVKNRGLIEEMVAEKLRHPSLRFIHVRGHKNNVDNVRADVLAGEARKKQTTNWKPGSW